MREHIKERRRRYEGTRAEPSRFGAKRPVETENKPVAKTQIEDFLNGIHKRLPSLAPIFTNAQVRWQEVGTALHPLYTPLPALRELFRRKRKGFFAALEDESSPPQCAVLPIN